MNSEDPFLNPRPWKRARLSYIETLSQGSLYFKGMSFDTTVKNLDFLSAIDSLQSSLQALHLDSKLPTIQPKKESDESMKNM